MSILFGLVLLLLVVAVVVLFAMFGELASRVPGRAEPDRTVRPYEHARIGATPAMWPDPVGDFVAQRRSTTAVLIVLSTLCTSCQAVAEQIATERRDKRVALDSVLVISCAVHERGQEFVDRYGLHSTLHYIDAGGNWVADSFGITVSPCALLIEDGALAAALVFQDYMALQAAVPTATTNKETAWSNTHAMVPGQAPSAGEASYPRSAPAP